MFPEHPPIQTPNLRQLLRTLILFVLAMWVGNVFLLALESQLGLYSYLSQPQLQRLASPWQWLASLC